MSGIPPRVPSGFNCVPDGRGGWIVSRQAWTVSYPCGKCGINKQTMWNLRNTQRHILPCLQCEPDEHYAAIEAIKNGEKPVGDR